MCNEARQGSSWALARVAVYYMMKDDNILGQKRKYCALNESCKITSAIYVLLLFLPHIIPIVSLSSVNPNQCTGSPFILKFFKCTFILFRFTHVITTEITSLIAPEKAAYCVFTQLHGPKNEIKLISVRTRTQLKFLILNSELFHSV